MEIQLRIVLLVIGLLILLGVAIDFYRRRPSRDTSRSGEQAGIANNDLLRAIGANKIAHHNQASLNNSHAYVSDDDLYHSDIEPEIDLDLDLSYSSTLELDELNDDLLSSCELGSSSMGPKISEPITAQEVIAIFIMSRDPAGFDGDDLYTAISNANFHLGSNDVFYRYSEENGKGEPLFTLVKAVEPGYFNISNLRNERVPGITLLMLPGKVTDPLAALDKLVRAAKQIGFVLNGELLDYQRQPLTLLTIEKYKAQIEQLEIETT